MSIIEGKLLMLDNRTPHVAVPIQAIRNGEVTDTALSDEDGKYQFIDLKPGTYQVRCQVLGGYVHYEEQKAGKPISLQVEPDKTLSNIDFHFPPFKKGTWRTITHFDGLANNHVLAVYQDSHGMMWFATRGGGVSRYDGKEFVNFTTRNGLANNYVFAIEQARDGTMWFGMAYSISSYDGVEFVNFDTEGLVHAVHSASDGIIWCGTWGYGVSYYNGKEFVNFTTRDGLAGDFVPAIYQDSSGIMWFGTNGGVSRYDGKKFTTFTTRDGLVHDSVHAIYGEPDGVLWFGTDGGVSRYDGKEFTNLTTEDGLINGIVSSIHRDPDGTMWFGTGFASGDQSGKGVSRYDGKGFANFTTSDGLAHNTVHSIHRDPDGVLWFGTDGGGVSSCDESGFINLTTRDGLAHDHIWSIYHEPDGDLWFPTDGGGVSRYDGKSFSTLNTRYGLPNDHVFCVLQDNNGAFWFGTDGGAVRYDGESFVTLTTRDGLAHDHVFCMHLDPDGTIWFGTWGGVSRYDPSARAGKGSFVNYTTRDGLAGNWVYSINRDPDGVMWICTVDGVSRYDGKKFTNLNFKDGLPSSIVFPFHSDPDGSLWFGTLAGVSRYDGKKFVNLTTEDGLAYNYVYDIYRDRDGTIWFATGGGGVSRYDGVAWTSLDMRDGLADNTVWAIHQDQNGVLWFGTTGGITCYRQSPNPPRTLIVSVKIGEEEYTHLEAIPPVIVGNHVAIKYSSIDFRTVPGKRQYRCRVYETGDLRRETSDSELKSQVSSLKSQFPYSRPTRETTFDWIPHKPGIYTFQVQSIDRDLNYSEPASLNLTVQPDPVLASMQTELNYLRHEVGDKYQFDSIIGRSVGIKQVRALMEKAVDSGLTVLITGETGTGKELAAKAIHYNSPRKDEPLLARNCGSIPRELLASELFGHRKGAFTGANEDKMGLFEAASGGTVLLDEITEMSEDAQSHLLRVLEEREVQRLGEHESRAVDVRVIALTNRDLAEEVVARRFREDLYYRLNVFPIHLPPLRERKEDITFLAEHFLQLYSQEQDKIFKGFAPRTLEMLQSYPWPGNVRELRNEVYRACALAEEDSLIQPYHFSHQVTRGESLIQQVLSENLGYSESLNQFRRRLVEKALRECNGNRTYAAKLLGMDRSNLVALIKRLGIEP
jgi:DNA-binding NtrC family response regulator/ligand-binding sensor domain-containing protein